MADDDDLFVYTGGDQEVPRDVRRAKIDESIDIIPRRAFLDCQQLIEVVGHDKLKKIEKYAFIRCPSLRRLSNMKSVIEIGKSAFIQCVSLRDLEFVKLEIIGDNAFAHCVSLRSIDLSSVRRVGVKAFQFCERLTKAIFDEDLERIGRNAFYHCPSLRRIAILLKDDLIIGDYAFDACENLSRIVALVGGVHETISSLHMKSWRDEMREQVDQINQTLLDTPPGEKTETIQQWIRSVLDKMEHYKTEHQIVLKEAMVLLELALWKAKLLNEEGMQREYAEGKRTKKAKIDVNSARKEHRVTCGAIIVIKNVLPFLALK